MLCMRMSSETAKVKQISTEELVKDDVILLTAGKQICADAVVISGNIQVNESLLTGEADEVEKDRGQRLSCREALLYRESAMHGLKRSVMNHISQS